MLSASTKTLLLIVLFISICEMIGQSCLKKFFLDKQNKFYFIIALFFYLIICNLLVISYDYKSMGLVNVIWSGLSVLVILSAGFFFFHETITPLDQLGVLLVISGIVCILWEE